MVAESHAEVWELEKDIFTHIMASLVSDFAKEIKESLRKIPILEQMEEDFFDGLVDHVGKNTYEK